jgi:Putative zinc-finger
MRTTRQLNCDEATRLISAGLDREMTAPARANLHLHYAVCSACKRVEQQLQLMRQTLRGLRVGDVGDRSDNATAVKPDPDKPSGDRQA